MIYTEETQLTAKKFNIELFDVIFAKMIAAGINEGEAYYITHNNNRRNYSNNETEKTKAKQYIQQNPGLKILIHQLKTKKPNTKKITETPSQTETIKTNLTERKNLIDFISTNLLQTTGKDAVSGAQTLAKLLGIDKIEEKKEEEKKIFHLPYKSACRVCEIYKVYLKTKELKND